MNLKQLLFDHLNTRQIIFKNSFWLAISEFAPRLARTVLVIFIARVLGATEYGKFSFALAFASFFVIFTDFGLSSIVVREFAKDQSQERHFPALFTLKIIMGFAVLIVTVLGSFIVTDDRFIRVAIWILAFYIFFQGLKVIFDSFFQARQRMEYGTVTRVAESATLLALGLFILFNAPSIFGIGASYAVASFAGLLLALVILQLKIAPLKIAFLPEVWKKFLLISWPLGLAGFSGTIIQNIDSLTLGFFGQLTQNGWYNAAYAIYNTVFLPSYIIGASFFPMLSKAFRSSLEQFQKIYNLQMEIAIFFAFGFLAGGFALAPKLIDFLYDPTYLPGVLALQILLAAVVFTFITFPAWQALIIADLQKRLFFATLAGAIVNMVLDIILVPQWSLYGTAFATFVASGVMAILFLRDTSALIKIKTINPQVLTTLLIGALCSGIMYLFLLFLQNFNLHVLFLVGTGGALYLLAFLAFRFIILHYSQIP